MSFGSRLHYLAIGGLVLALCAGEGQAQNNSASPGEQSQQQQPAAEPAPPQAKPDTGYRQPTCKSPASADEANFCEQRRSADAAEQQAIWAKEQAYWNKAQFWIGTAGLVAVVFSLVFTGWAAFGAVRAAEATTDANRLSKENATADRRAWLNLEDVQILHPTEFQEGYIGFCVQATTKNMGRSPAANVEIRFRSHFDGGENPKFSDEEKTFKEILKNQPSMLGQTLFPDDTFTQRLRWAVDAKEFVGAIQTRKDGKRYIGFTMFIAVVYRVMGDETVHSTYRTHGMLNVPVGFTIPEGKSVPLPALPFLSGEVT